MSSTSSSAGHYVNFLKWSDCTALATILIFVACYKTTIQTTGFSLNKS